MKADGRWGNSVPEAGAETRRRGEPMMDHPQIDDEQVIERYLLGELDALEAERFEDHFLICSRCLDQLETDERLSDAIRALAPESRPRTSAWARPLLAAAAVLLLLLPALFFFARRGAQLERQLGEARRETAELRAGLATEQTASRDRLSALETRSSELSAELARATLPRVSSLLLRLSPQRSAPGEETPAHRLRLGPEPAWVVLLVELGADPGERCRAVLTGIGGERLWSADDLAADSYGALAVSLYAPTLAAGEHRLRVEMATGEVVEQRFLVVR